MNFQLFHVVATLWLIKVDYLHLITGFVALFHINIILLTRKILIHTFFYIKTIEHLYYCHKKLFLTIYCCYLIFVDVMDDYIIVRFQSQFPKSIVFLPWKNKSAIYFKIYG